MGNLSPHLSLVPENVIPSASGILKAATFQMMIRDGPFA
jgi:hypothetical protein